MATRSLKVRILLSSLAIISVLSLLTALLGFYTIKNDVINIAQSKVKNDLDFTREIYKQETRNLENTIRLIAMRFFLRDAILENNIETLQKELNNIRTTEGLDILTLLNKDGHVIVRARNAAVRGDNQQADEVVSKVLSEKKATAATTIIPRSELAKESEELTEQAHIQFTATAKAKPTKETEQTSGMMIKAAAPVFDNEGNYFSAIDFPG